MLSNRRWTTAVFAAVAVLTLGCGESGFIAPNESADEVSSVVVAPGSYTLDIAATVQLEATARDLDGRIIKGSPVQWTSTDTVVAAVDPMGTVTGMSDGSAEIHAKSRGKRGTAHIRVSKSSSSLSCQEISRVVITPAADTLRALGATVQLAAAALDSAGTVIPGVGMSWTSLNSVVASVSTMGLVSARTVGTALVVAVAAACTQADTMGVVVEQVVSSLTISPPSASVATGSSVTLQATAMDAGGNPVSNPTIGWISTAPSIASVNGSGAVMGIAAGTASIVAVSGSQADTAAITVTSPPQTPPPPTGATLNEPVGMTPFLRADGSQRDFGPQWMKMPKWTDNRWTEVVPDAGNPTGSGMAIEKRWYAGEPTDNGNGLIELGNFSDIGGFPAKELYIRYRLKFSPNWDDRWNPKHFYWSFDASGVPNKNFIAGSPGGNYPLYIESYYNESAITYGFSGWQFTKDTWHTIEIHQIAPSAPGVADGSLKVWADGQLVINLKDRNFVPGGVSSALLDGCQLFYIRGQVGNTFSVNDWLRLGEFYISGKR